MAEKVVTAGEKTVQTSWRPQLPLPKELDDDASDSTDEQSAAAADAANMERSGQQRTTSHGSSRKHNTLSGAQAAALQTTQAASASNKKWSFGRLFRRKKEIATESSSEEDRKAGFVPHQQRQPPRLASGATGSSANLKTKASKSHKVSRSGKLNGASFDHIVVSPQTSGAPSTPPHPPPPAHVDHEFFLPVETISPTEAYYQNQQPQYLQHGAQPAAYTRSANSLDRRAARAALKTRSAQRLPHESAPGAHSSSEEELISLNSSTFSKYRSDESIHSGGQGAANAQNSRRSRAARNERYYKRLSRDGEPSSGQVPVMYAPQPTQRWKTQPVPLSIYNPAAQAPTVSAAAAAAATPRLRNTSSLQHVAPYVQWGQLQQQPKNLQNTVNDSKRSISYDSHIHLQNINGRLQTKPLPPPPPPRDPLRRVNVSGQMQNGSAGDLRPISYAFDQSGLPTLPATNQRMGGRCVSDDKIWSGPAGPHYQSVHSLNTPSGASVTQPMPQATPHHRRFITRAERDAHPAKKSLPNGIEFHYVADATPRSRKPIHMLEPQLDAASNDVATTGILRTSKSGLPTASSKQMQVNDFWKRLDASTHQRGRDTTRAYGLESNVKPRSISSSRVGELRAYPIPVYSEVQKPNKKRTQAAPPHGADEVDSIVCGSLHIKSKPDSNSNFVEIRNKDYSKSSSMPNHYQRRSGEIPNTPNKYDEYVAEKREQHHKPIFTPPTPPQRKLSIPPSSATPELPIYFPRKKPANLEEAINELEAIYKSLGLTEEPEKKERVPTPSEFEKYALAHAHEYDDEDSPTGEPDPIRDDVAYRNMQLANLQHKTVEKQPPFGIPVGPVVAAPQNDYLHVTPIVEPIASVNTPDIVKDDLAVRALRKDPPGAKDKFIYPYSSFQKKNRATRTQSANIYNLIHRDAAKPSGGDLHSYLELTRSLERAGSMSDLHKDAGATAADVPTTLALLRNLKEQDQQQQQQPTPQKKVAIPFRHPSQGGAICALPEKLPTSSAHKEEVHKAPVPLPRKSLTPEPTAANAQMEDALNKIAMDAQEKSEKLTKELQELRKEALITAARPKAASAEEERLEKDLQEIEAVSEAAKRCGKMLLDTLPDATENTVQAKPRKLHKEGKLIEAIDQVSEAANAVCEKILKDIVTTEPPVVIQEAVQVKNKQTPTEMLVMPNLIKKLDPIQSEQIEAIAKRCMRQLSALADDNPDYDNLNQELQQQQQQQQSAAGAATAVACNVEHLPKASAAKVDNLISTVAEVTPGQPAAAHKQHTDIEEIDQIMQECEEQMPAETVNSSTTTAPPPIVLSERTLATARPLVTANTKNGSSDDHTTAPSMTTSSYCSSTSSNNVVGATKPGASTTASSFSSSSDCLAKSSSPSAGRRQSSSITSFNPYSSSDYIKSPSSEYHAPSTDPIKTFSSTSYDVKSTTSAATPNISATTNSTFSYSPSPPLNLTPVSETAAIIATEVGRAASATRQSQERTRTRSSSSPSQYNSSEELAMIFGIDEQPRRQRAKQQAKEMQSATKVSGKTAVTKSVHVPSAPLTSTNHASALHATMLDTATNTTTTTTTTTTIYTTANATQLYTNPNIVAVAEACETVAPPNTNNTAPLNVIAVVDDNVEVVVVDIDVKDTTTTTTTTTSISTITTNNPTTIAINTNLKNSSTSLSPSSYKLASIPETQADELSECNSPKLSPNFNKIYASKISIIVDGMRAEPARNVELTALGDSSLSSCEDETSSNPDSGNVSLADYPLTNTQTNNACLQLESAYNSRFEIKKKKRNFVSEIAIERTAVEPNTEGEYKSETAAEDFPPPPSEEELLDSLLGAISVGDAEKETIERVDFQVEQITRESNNSGILESQFELLEDKENLRGTADSFEAQSSDENSYKASSLSETDIKTESLGKCASNENLLESQNRELPNLDESVISENGFESQNEDLFFTGNELSESLGAENPLKESTVEKTRTEQQKPKPIERKSRSSKKLDDADLIELAQLVRSSSGSRRSSEASTADAYSADSEYNSAEELKCTATSCISAELEQLRLAFSDILERNLTDIDELPRIEEEDDAVAALLNQEEKEENTVSEHIELNDEIYETPRRKLSVVYETPSLNLNISEVKISYTPADQLESESAAQDALTQITQCNTEVEELKALPETRLKFSSSTAASDSSSLLPWRRRHDALEEDEKPSTSAAAAVKATNERRALSIFGELRPTAAAATSSLTTLEHVLMACSLGVITPTDLYTLCLIIIGMITIIAIVLF